jgi:hypothetical protein
VSTSKKNSNSTTDDVVPSAKAEREAAQAAHDVAVEAVRAKREEVEALRQRSAVDDTVTGLDIVAAQADLTILDARVTAAADRVEEARKVEADAVTQSVADQIAEKIDPTSVTRMEDEAVAAITAALSRLAQHAEEVRDLVQVGVREAEAVGIGYGTKGRLRLGMPEAAAGRRGRHLVVDGVHVLGLPANDTLLDVLSRAVGGAGFTLTTAYGNVTVKDSRL